MKRIDKYHPIRQKMFWVGIIQFVASGLILAGVGADLVNGWSAWLAGGLNLLVLGGVLSRGAAQAEKNTTPLNELGEPLNPSYELKRVA